MEIKNKKIIAVIVLVALAFSVESCRLFKKKCDCPKFGKAPAKTEIKKKS
jgi:hypothetical protein